MSNHISNKSYKIFLYNLTFLYLLNALDIVFTLLLLQTGMFYEANIIMAPIVANTFWCISIKIILPAILILYLMISAKRSDIDSFKVSNILVSIVCFIYIGIVASHLFYAYDYVTFLRF